MKSWKAPFIFDYNSLKLEITRRKPEKNTKMWILNILKKPMSQPRNQKGNKISCTKGNARFQNSVDATQAVLRWKFTALQAYL